MIFLEREHRPPRIPRRPGVLRGLAVAAALTFTFTFALGSASGRALAEPHPALTEAPVKAAIVLNLTKFVQWPDSIEHRGGAPMTMLIVGSDPVADAIDALADSLTRKHRITLEHGRDARHLQTADIVYLAGSEGEHLREILDAIGARPVLTISDLPDFARHGGICSFRPKQERVGLEINLDRAKTIGLQISSKVLALSTIVSDQP